MQFLFQVGKRELLPESLCESKMTHHAAVPVKLIREAKEIISSSVHLLC